MSDSSADSKNGSTHSRHGATHVTTRSHKKAHPSPAKTDAAVPRDHRRYKVRVPPFSPEEPEIWFALLEGQFELYNITDDATKFTQVVTNLDITHAKAVKDLILNPPERHRYDKTKTELIRRLSASHETKIKQLLIHEELGDRKPSQFLRHLKDLGGPAVPDEFIRTIWSQRLPSNVQTVLASQPTLSTELLADLADRIHEIVTPALNSVAMTSINTTCSGPTSEIAELKKTVERLAMRVRENSRPPYHHADGSRNRQRTTSHHRARSNQRSTPRSRASTDYHKYPLCWYHFRFGNKAQKCVKPCDHAGNAQGSQ